MVLFIHLVQFSSQINIESFAIYLNTGFQINAEPVQMPDAAIVFTADHDHLMTYTMTWEGHQHFKILLGTMV